ncbi:hypothetical protein vseg_010560 [Gypsophila vaccaria]
MRGKEQEVGRVIGHTGRPRCRRAEKRSGGVGWLEQAIVVGPIVSLLLLGSTDAAARSRDAAAGSTDVEGWVTAYCWLTHNRTERGRRIWGKSDGSVRRVLV